MTTEFFAKMQRLNLFIRHKATGDADTLASRLDVHRSTVYHNLKLLRNLGAEISYDRERQTYYYTNGFDLKNYFS